MSKFIEEVVGRDITIRFEARRCIHSRACVLGRPDVFVPNVEGEWIHPNAAKPEEADTRVCIGVAQGGVDAS